MKKGLSKRMLVLIIAIVIIVITTVIIVININKGKEKVPNNGGNNVETPKVEEKDPETKPSIDGNENISESNGIKVNKSEKMKESKKIETYTISNAKITYSNGKTTFTADVTSTSTTKLAGIDVKIKLLDKSGKYISALSAYIPQVKPGETQILSASSSSDLTNAYNYEIVKE
ncbi:MAG: FxLYD domain-containing protein [Clostridia bacterium]